MKVGKVPGTLLASASSSLNSGIILYTLDSIFQMGVVTAVIAQDQEDSIR